MIRILIADDHDVVRSGLRHIIEAQQNWQVVAEAGDGKEAVQKALETKPDVAVIDYWLPLINGVESTRQIRAALPHTEILIFTMHDNETLIQDLLKAGARGYLLKTDARRHLGSLLYGLRAEVPFFEALRADLPKLRSTPLLLLYGIKDHGYQAGFLERWKSVVPEASVTLLQKSGHFAPEDEPETFTAALSEWLAQRGASQPRASIKRLSG